jgi:hypothetical protein
MKKKISHLIAAAVVIPDFGQEIGLGTADLKTVVVRVLQLVLGLAPLAAVAMIIVGGFMWMTSVGDEEKLMRAKRVISSAVIGLIIVIIAWAVVSFVARTVLNVSS